MPDTKDFATLSISREMLQNLKKIGYEKMTPVQAESLPYILQNRDIIAQAKTGSGKTAAFGIGLLTKLNIRNFQIQSLVICPTRELAEQVATELRNIAKFQHNIKILTLCGGVAFGPQLASLKHGAHIVIGTPGRILGHLAKGSLNLKNLKILVLDEADRMLDMGFFEEIEKIIEQVPNERQTLLFSATFPDEILDISKEIQKDALNIKTASIEVANDVKEYFYQINHHDKFKTLKKVLSTFGVNSAIIFCNTKQRTKELAEDLRDNNIDALALHGDLEQYERNDVLVQFTNASCCILVATDVAARGLDIKKLDMVINYDFPHTKEIYTHRIGRTARGGEHGIAVSLIDEHNNGQEEFNYDNPEKLELKKDFKLIPKNITVVIEGGKKQKIRAGDILGSLTKDGGIDGKEIGKIDIFDRQSYVAIDRKSLNRAHNHLKNSKIKGKNFSVWILE